MTPICDHMHNFLHCPPLQICPLQICPLQICQSVHYKSVLLVILNSTTSVKQLGPNFKVLPIFVTYNLVQLRVHQISQQNKCCWWTDRQTEWRTGYTFHNYFICEYFSLKENDVCFVYIEGLTYAWSIPQPITVITLSCILVIYMVICLKCSQKTQLMVSFLFQIIKF